MRVLVLWEDEREIDDAENLANVLASLAPSLAVEGKCDGKGGVEINCGYRTSYPKVLVRTASWASHFDQLMRSVLDVTDA